MFVNEQLRGIEIQFESGQTPDEVAASIGISRNTLLLRLARSGKKIVTYRRLEDIVPVETGDQRREAVAA